MDPYLDAVRQLYKELVTVVKDPAGAISVASHVWVVEGWEGAPGLPPLFPPGDAAAAHSLCLLFVDPLRRTVRLEAKASAGRAVQPL